MPDEPKDAVSLDDLHSAFEQAGADADAEPVKEDVQAEVSVADDPGESGENLPDEPEDHGDRSKLGRRVSEMEKRMEGSLAEIKELLSRREEQQQQAPWQDPYMAQWQYGNQQNPYQPPSQAAEEDEDFVDITSRAQLDKEVARYLQRKEAEDRTRGQQYERQYAPAFVREMQTNGITDAKEQEAVWNVMVQNFNVRYSDNAAHDAQINFLKAQNELLKQQATADKQPKPKESPLKGGQPTAPLGVSQTAKEAPAKEPEMPDLDPWALKFVQRTGMDKKAVSEALGGATPDRLRRKGHA